MQITVPAAKLISGDVQMNTGIIVLGLLSGFLLFLRFRFLPNASDKNQQATFSVIIPARNEQANLPLLLADIAAQTVRPLEVICVDDESTDNTAQVAAAGAAKVISITQKPAGWTGKSYACQTGAESAQGAFLLFLDADVRLAPSAFRSLFSAYARCRCTLSVQPYHLTYRWFEQLSLFFNLIAAASLGAPLPVGPKTRGLFGPVIFIAKKDYHLSGGHAGVKGRVLEDIGLGRALDAQGLPYRCFLGGKEIAFRMYAQGPQSLLEGWTKNFASGALSSAPLFMVAISLWIAAMFIIPMRFAATMASGQGLYIALYGALYALMVGLLLYGAGRVGRFKFLAVLLYPVCLVFFLGVFLLSLFKKIFRRPVRWKGRDIEEGN